MFQYTPTGQTMNVEPCARMIPGYAAEKLTLWAKKQHPYPMSGFLYAVLTNNLKEAVMTADSTNMELLPAYVAWCYSKLPAASWGSVEKVEGWMAKMHDLSILDTDGGRT